MEKKLKFTKKYTIKLYFGNKVDEIIIPNDATIPELEKLIYDKYLLSHFNYSIFYNKLIIFIIFFLFITSFLTFQSVLSGLS